MSPTRPTVVLLHGVGLSGSIWEPVAELLAGDHDVITPDLPGHGSAGIVPEGATLADLADGIAGQVPAGAHVVGFSLGALVAQHLAVHRPDLVATLTSVSSVCRRTPAEQDAVLLRLAAAEADFPTSVAASLERWYSGTTVDTGWRARTESVLLANDRTSFLACYRVFATADAELAPYLSGIAVPALAVTGADDPGSTPEMSRRLADALPDCRVVVVPGARHMLPVERPRELVDAVTTFIGTRTHA